MNREQREGHERGETEPTNFRGENYSRHFLLLFPPLPPEPLRDYREHSILVRFESTTDTPFFVRGFRTFRGENYNEHSR